MWVKIGDHLLLTAYCPGQNRLDLGKFNVLLIKQANKDKINSRPLRSILFSGAASLPHSQIYLLPQRSAGGWGTGVAVSPEQSLLHTRPSLSQAVVLRDEPASVQLLSGEPAAAWVTVFFGCCSVVSSRDSLEPFLFPLWRARAVS